jgi:type I restriction enzyme S subunit
METRNRLGKCTDLGLLPEGWGMAMLGDLASIVSGGTPSKNRPEFWNGTIPWASPKDMKRLRLADTEDHISEGGLSSGSRLVPSGSIFIVVRGMILARDIPIAMAISPMAFNQDIKAIQPHTSITASYLLYALLSSKEQLRTHIGLAGHGTRRIGTESIEQLILPVPSLEEQVAIAIVLDKIQAAIDGQQTIIDRTIELKSALIAKIFTEGLRDEPLKNTPIGMLPISWQVATLAELISIANGQVDPKDTPYRDMFHIGPEDVEENTGRHLNRRTASEVGLISGKYLFNHQDIIYSKIRPYLKKAVRPDFTGICSADMYPIRPSNSCITRDWLFYLIFSESFTKQATGQQDRTGIPKLNRHQLLSIMVPVPLSIDEQNRYTKATRQNNSYI